MSDELASLLEALGEAAATIDAEGHVVAASELWRARVRERSAALGRPAHPDDLAIPACCDSENAARAGLALVIAGRSASYEQEHGCTRCGMWPGSVLAIRPIGARPGPVLARIHDASRRAPWTEGWLRQIFEGAPLGMTVVTPDGRVRAANETFASMMGYTRQEIEAVSFPDLTHPDDRAATTAFGRALFEGRMQRGSLEKRNVRKDGTVIWVRLHSTMIPGGNGGTPYAFTIFEEVGERRRAEDALRTALAEKEVMLREIHHRVKNNLQVITSLLALQRETTTDPSARAALAESANRVRTIGLLHEQLHASNRLERIVLVDYLERIVEELARIQSRPAIEVRVTGDRDATVGIDEALPCGLSVHELVNNAFKHAFPEGRRGLVEVRVSRGAGGALEICVADDGIGMRPGAGTLQTLGLSLVVGLVRQLRGKLVFERPGRGHLARITFGPAPNELGTAE